MSENFTQGEWKVEEREANIRGIHLYGFLIQTKEHRICKCQTDNDRNIPVMKANAALIAAAPGMYRNEKANLHVIKTLLKVYEELQRLFSTDEEVQKAFPNMPTWTLERIISELKNRINETEETLKKARGEE